MFELNEDTRWILGRPCFTVAKIAWLLRDSGYREVATKAEDEQAVAIYWMLEMYEKHGANWREEADKRIKEMHQALTIAKEKEATCPIDH